MILSATLSKPSGSLEKALGRDYIKIKINFQNSKEGGSYFLEMFTKTQVFHEHLKESEIDDYLEKNIGTNFKSCVIKTTEKEITCLTNKKGKTTRLEKPLNLKAGADIGSVAGINTSASKNYILSEGNPVPFLVFLGIMTDDGKVISKRYDKFRQINRFLEFIDDIIPQVLKLKKENGENEKIKIIDFGCGKSYLTFAVHYYLTQIKKLPCQIEGLDIKKDVIDYCNDITNKLNLKNLHFSCGHIEDYDLSKEKENTPDLIITLHACDTATDYALEYAVEKNTKAILSVPCCQHQINTELSKKGTNKDTVLEPLLKWGLIREKFSSLLTDALRGQWLEKSGYTVQMLEFIDEEHTPKNILIRAVRKPTEALKDKSSAAQRLFVAHSKADGNKPEIISYLGISPEIWKKD